MSVYYQDERVTLHLGDCLDVLATLPDSSVDAVVTDPPYGLANTTPQQVADTLVRWVNGERDYLPGGKGFMGKSWDAFVPPVAVWDECLRVLKPGGHVLTFAGSRTMDLMTLGLRLAGFDIRDSIAWLYGSGFPKSMNVAKAITGTQMGHGGNSGAIRRATMGDDYAESGRQGNRDGAGRRDTGLNDHTLNLTPDAERWQGWGTALKPAFEPVVVARKPLAGTVAANVLQHGTGALNVDGCRVAAQGRPLRESRSEASVSTFGNGLNGSLAAGSTDAGRWPTNVVLDQSQAYELDRQSGERPAGGKVTGNQTSRTGQSGIYGEYGAVENNPYGDTGGASRFFPTFRYEAKAPTAERPKVNGVGHPTVKPLDLMAWLVRLVTPPGGTVLEPFAGSGTTVEAALTEGVNCIAIERDADYLPLITQRINRRRDPIAYTRAAGEDLGLFDFEEPA